MTLSSTILVLTRGDRMMICQSLSVDKASQPVCVATFSKSSLIVLVMKPKNTQFAVCIAMSLEVRCVLLHGLCVMTTTLCMNAFETASGKLLVILG